MLKLNCVCVYYNTVTGCDIQNCERDTDYSTQIRNNCQYIDVIDINKYKSRLLHQIGKSRKYKYTQRAVHCRKMCMRTKLPHGVRRSMHTHDTLRKIEKIKMTESIREMSSEIGDNHDNFDRFNDQDVFEGTLPDVEEIAKGALNDLLPTPSKERYELEYAKQENF